MSAAMVRASWPMKAHEIRALLEGRMTQARRAVKAPTATGRFVLSFNHGIAEFNFGPDDRKPNGDLRWHRPHGMVGDLLWVREAHYVIGEYSGDNDGSRWAHYRADQSNNRADSKDIQWTGPWKPGIHMPRWASRLTLRITDVRVERLQDISNDDAVAEGAAGHPDGMWHAYRSLWTLINGPDSWDANPWVWAIRFEVIRKNVDEVLKHG